MRPFAFLLLLGSMLGAQLACSRPNWSAREVTARRLEQLDAGSSRLVPNAGIRVLEVSALLASADPSRLTLKVEEVYVKPSAEAPRAELLAVGMGGTDGCLPFSYMLTKGIVRGSVISTDRAGNGYGLGRKTEQDPLEITFIKSPTRLCLAFFVPASARSKMTLHFGDATVPVQLP
jgi:hypothetical protein